MRADTCTLLIIDLCECLLTHVRTDMPAGHLSCMQSIYTYICDPYCMTSRRAPACRLYISIGHALQPSITGGRRLDAIVVWLGAGTDVKDAPTWHEITVSSDICPSTQSDQSTSQNVKRDLYSSSTPLIHDLVFVFSNIRYFAGHLLQVVWFNESAKTCYLPRRNSTMVKPWCHLTKHGQKPCFTMVDYEIPWSTMNYHTRSWFLTVFC